MQRHELEHLIRAAAAITNEYEILDARIPPGYDNMMVALRKHGQRHPESGRIVVRSSTPPSSTTVATTPSRPPSVC